MKLINFKEKYFLLRAQNKDPEAFSQIYDFYVERIYRFVYFKVSNQEDAQDLTSDVFLKTWQYITDGKEIKNLNALLYKIARNSIIDHYRKASQKDVSLETDAELLSQQKHLFQKDSLEKKVDTKMRVAKIEARLNDLKDEYREVIILRYIDGLGIGEIADIVGKKKGNVRVILYRATNILKDMMTEDDKKL